MKILLRKDLDFERSGRHSPVRIYFKLRRTLRALSSLNPNMGGWKLSIMCMSPCPKEEQNAWVWFFVRTAQRSHDSMLTPSLPQRVTFPGWKVHTYTPANSIFYGPVTNLLSVLCILIGILLRAHTQGKKALIISNLTLLSVVFRAMARQSWQWKGWYSFMFLHL